MANLNRKRASENEWSDELLYVIYFHNLGGGKKVHDHWGFILVAWPIGSVAFVCQAKDQTGFKQTP